MSIEEVQSGIYRIPSVLGPRRFAQWLVVGDERLLLVDSGVDGTIEQHVAPALAELGRRVDQITDVVVSHADVDHYGGNSALRRLAPRARIVAHEVDRPLIESWGTAARERYGWYRRHGLDYDAATWSWLKHAAGPDTAVDGTIAPGDVLDLGGLSVAIVALPGHSPGHIGVLHRESGTAIVMDAVLERGLYTVDGAIVGPPPYGSVADYRGSIARLRELAPQRLGTSHYAPVEGAAEVTRFLDATAAFVDDLGAVVRKELADEPRPLAEFWRVADAELGPFPEMAVELARSVGAHLDLAVADGVARQADAGGTPGWGSA